MVCHATGVAGPRSWATRPLWAPRIATGIEALYNSSLKARTRCRRRRQRDAADADVKAAVDYMVAQSQ
jgi:cytochrome c5